MLLYRIDHDMVFEEMKSMDKNNTATTATLLLKDNYYWIYHANTIDKDGEEKNNPADKLWLIVKYMSLVCA